ncbi:hypothetical protein ACQ4PT_026060 [Festuca glaucescens]
MAGLPGGEWCSRKTLVALGLGQLVSLIVTSTGLASSELSRRGINMPTSQWLLNYLLLGVVYGGILMRRRKPLQEFLVKAGDRIELMGMLGLFGAIISACQIIVFERNEIKSIQWSTDDVVPFIGFAVAMFMLYSLVPILLKISGST